MNGDTSSISVPNSVIPAPVVFKSFKSTVAYHLHQHRSTDTRLTGLPIVVEQLLSGLQLISNAKNPRKVIVVATGCAGAGAEERREVRATGGGARAAARGGGRGERQAPAAPAFGVARSLRTLVAQCKEPPRASAASRANLFLILACVAATLAAPAPNPDPAPNPEPAPNPDPAGDDRPEIIEIIAPAASAQETLATLNLGAPGSELSERNKRTIGILRQLFPSLTQNAIADENQLLSGAESQQAEVRVAFGEGQQDQQVAASEDQQVAAQNNAATIDEITLDDTDTSEENRNKRFLNFGGSAGASGGGSGNFLFDIVRLVAGSSSGSSGDAGAGAEGDDVGAGKGDNLTEGVPGPITRLFIIANRGIANLIQDLILRIAQTSERIVNFKARLITSII
ncbi:hypothetical protein K1T71_012403 [Dendrolimus kikuchii]|uniref:Uncharacterized protein n=1 Tax=Dendrolimus kikuchii TaxID=765133 RepID=A0ACC1CLF9_9NEOP|nr:hypothetical protein K1T71_012403 [Dendrolimus kikuchii]